MVVESGHSRFPVHGEDKDDILGILLAKDLLRGIVADGGPGEIRELLRPAILILCFTPTFAAVSCAVCWPERVIVLGALASADRGVDRRNAGSARPENSGATARRRMHHQHSARWFDQSGCSSKRSTAGPIALRSRRDRPGGTPSGWRSVEGHVRLDCYAAYRRQRTASQKRYCASRRRGSE